MKIHAFNQNQYSARYTQQHILKHKRYEPVWSLFQKLRGGVSETKLSECNDNKILEELRMFTEEIQELALAIESQMLEELQKTKRPKTNSRSALAYDFLRENISEHGANHRLKNLIKGNPTFKLPKALFQFLIEALAERIRKINKLIKVDYLRHYINELLHFLKIRDKNANLFEEMVLAVIK